MYSQRNQVQRKFMHSSSREMLLLSFFIEWGLAQTGTHRLHDIHTHHRSSSYSSSTVQHSSTPVADRVRSCFMFVCSVGHTFSPKYPVCRYNHIWFIETLVFKTSGRCMCVVCTACTHALFFAFGDPSLGERERWGGIEMACLNSLKARKIRI